MPLPADWYPDPDHPQAQLRYWDGQQWTTHVHLLSAAPQPQRKKLPTSVKVLIPVLSVVVGLPILLFLVVVGIGAVGAITGGVPTTAEEEDVYDPLTATLEENIAYYDEYRPAVVAFLEENPHGHPYSLLQAALDGADEAVDAARVDPDHDPYAPYAEYEHLSVLLEIAQEDIAAWEIEYGLKIENEGNATGTDAEAALDTASAGVSAIIQGDCGSAKSLACVHGGSTVTVPAHMWGLTDEEMLARHGTTWLDVMIHEYAHVVQNKYEFRLMDNPEYLSLFDQETAPPEYADLSWDRELSAECMAETIVGPEYARGYPGTCSPEQLALATKIWVGEV
jgi:hypothetical protein